MSLYGWDLNGGNCQFEGQPLLSLSVTEDVESDYPTASCVCIGKPLQVGSEGTLVEGGQGTGLWVVETATDIKSGEKTWRSKAGAGYAHIPMTAYRLRRKGWLECRATISKSLWGPTAFPPKFYGARFYDEWIKAAQQQVRDKEISEFAYLKMVGSVKRVASGQEIISALAGKIGLPIDYKTKCGVAADDYQPVGKTLLTAIKEVASWSGASCYLGRSGVLHIFSFESMFSTATATSGPRQPSDMETTISVAPINQVTVVAKGYRGQVKNWPARPAHKSANGKYDRPATPAHTSIIGHTEEAFEVTVRVEDGLPCVEERIEITGYHINPAIAQSIAQDRLARSALTSCYCIARGPGQGTAGQHPVAAKVLSVTRTLSWGGTGYKYTTEIKAPAAQMPSTSGGGGGGGGWW